MAIDDERYQRAKRRMEAEKGFYIHLFVYAAVNTGLFLINFVGGRGEGNWWFVWPLAGWGIAVVVHGLSVFVFGRARPPLGGAPHPRTDGQGPGAARPRRG